MSAPINNGGPAFPTSFNKDYPTEIVGGMTLRDYFAAKAMQGAISSIAYHAKPSAGDVAAYAYKVADAMLRAREAA